MKRVGGKVMLNGDRANFNDSTTAKDLCELAKLPELRVLQCSAPVRDSVWKLVNEHFVAARPDVLLRVYGFDEKVCDLAFARLLTNVHRFSVDNLCRATNVEAVAEIPRLEQLGLGIFELTDFGVLDRVTPRLNSLNLGDTRSKQPTLAPLSRFRSLRELCIAGHSNDISVLSELAELEDVNLVSIATSDIRYLSPLKKLSSLAISLGGIESFAGIEKKKSIKYLGLTQVRGLRDISVVGSLPGLQNLFLRNLPHVGSFPILKSLKALRRIIVWNLKGLQDFTALGTAPVLEEFALLDGSKQAPEQLLPVLENPRVRSVIAGLGSVRKNNEFLRLREEYGKGEFDQSDPFEYR